MLRRGAPLNGILHPPIRLHMPKDRPFSRWLLRIKRGSKLASIKLRSWILPDLSQASTKDLIEEPRRRIFLVAVGLTCAMWCSDFVATKLISGTISWIDKLPELLAILATGTFAIFLTKVKKFDRYAQILNGIMFSGMVASIVQSGGSHSPELVWLVGFPIIAWAFLGWKKSVVWALACAAVPHLFRWGLLPDMPSPNVDPATHQIFLLRVSSGAFVIHGLCGLSASGAGFLLKRLDQRTEQLMHLAADRENLARVLTHDFANIATVLDLAIHKLNAHLQVGSDAKMALSKALGAVERLKAEIQSVRMLQAVISGKQRLLAQRVNLKQMVVAVVAEIRGRMNHGNVRFDVKIPEDISIDVDPTTFCQQVLSNVVSNALKFSPNEGQIEIEASIDRHGLVALTISDHGPGIEVPRLQTLFDLNASSSTRGVRGERGTGFGLPIAKRVMELNGGRLNITSRHEADVGPNHSGTQVTLFLKSSGAAVSADIAA